MPQGFWLKTAVGSTWSRITNFYIKTSTAGWAQVQDAWIKTTTGGWTKFFAALMAPSQQVELDYQYGGYDSETLQIRGKNYVWSPTPQSLKYYFRAVNEDGTTYVGSGGSSGATATNTISYYPGTSTYLSINPSDYNYKVGGLTKYFFEVRATGASGTVYSSLSNDVYAEVASPLAPTLSIQSSTSTSVTVRVTAASTTTGTWGFSSWAATYRYIVYTYDSVGGTIYTGGGRGGISATSSAQDITLTGLTAGRSYYIYVLPVTGTVGTRPFPYNASTQTNGYSGYPGVEAYILFEPPSPPTISSNPTFTLQSGTANTVNSVYRLSSGTWNGSPTEYRYEIGRNDPAGTVIATFPSTTTWTTQTYYDHTFTSTTAGYSVYGSVIAKNANGQSVPATASSSIGPITANPQSTGQMRRLTMPIAFAASSQTVWVGTNGYVSTTVDPTTSPGTSWPSAGGVVIGPAVADLRQTSLSYKSDSSNFYVRWQGCGLSETAGSVTIDYLMKFTWSSTTVDVYFITNSTTASLSTDAIRYPAGTSYQTWAGSTSITGMTIPTGMTSDSTNNNVDDNRTAITASKPALNLTTNPAYGTSTGTSTGWTASISTSPNPTGGTYSVVSQTAGSATVNSTSGALTASGLTSGQASTVTVRYSLSGYNSVDITASGTATSAVAAPTNSTVPTLSGGLAVGSTFTFGVGTWTGSPTSYDLRLYRGTQFVSSTETLVKSAGNVTSSTYVIPQSDYDDSNNRKYYRAFATATNAGGTSSLVAGQELGPITPAASLPGTPTITGNNSLAVGGTFTWSATGATGYYFSVYAPNGSLQYSTYGSIVTTTSFRPGYDATWAGAGNYTIYVVARNSAGDSPAASLTTYMS